MTPFWENSCLTKPVLCAASLPGAGPPPIRCARIAGSSRSMSTASPRTIRSVPMHQNMPTCKATYLESRQLIFPRYSCTCIRCWGIVFSPLQSAHAMALLSPNEWNACRMCQPKRGGLSI
ncbi:hypothetical protein CENSYa_0800 [Cenarchaeum symbiosum A]|uniref:Uncharacterized protein n=1 Tax=Cenarchaeum symbiosum (strain A) TaxID=414004 RepID=A0RVR6_CENSY|nr:hypothetical protein CENSYa_0800 [Cenarchaeum symbiosum A]